MKSRLCEKICPPLYISVERNSRQGRCESKERIVSRA